MKKCVAVLFSAAAMLLLAGCSAPKLPVNQTELSMMPPEVALKLIKQRIPSADKYGFMASKKGVCLDQANVWTNYWDVNRAFYSAQNSFLALSSTGFCFNGIDLRGVSPSEATEIGAAMNVLGARIPHIVGI